MSNLIIYHPRPEAHTLWSQMNSFRDHANPPLTLEVFTSRIHLSHRHGQIHFRMTDSCFGQANV